nr:odorant-binding protein 9 [Psyttalia incisi]
MNTSIFWIFCAFATVVVLAEDMKLSTYEISQKCINETGARLADWSTPLTPPANTPMNRKCYMACIMKAYGLMAEDGTLREEHTIAQIPQNAPNYEKMVAGIQKCFKITEANVCERAYAIEVCTRAAFR